MKNAPLYALVAALISIAIFFIWGFYVNFVGDGAGTVSLGFFCGVILIVVALVAFELMFKRAVLFPLLAEEEE
jgi:hypothetical protein